MVAVVLMCGGCSGVPFTPAKWFEPSPTAPPRDAAPSRAVRPGDPEVQFDGVLKTVDGLTATFATRLYFGDVITSRQLSGPRPGWVSVTLPVTGELSVTNTSTRPNAAAASVVVEYNAGYPATSRICELMSGPEMRNRYLAGGFCWRSAGTATLFSYSSGPPTSIEPGAGFGAEIGEPSNLVRISVEAPAAEVGDIAGQITSPAVMVATTNDIPGLGTSFRFSGACMDPTHVPTSPSGPGPTTVSPGEQHAIVGATRYLTCDDLPDLGN